MIRLESLWRVNGGEVAEEDFSIFGFARTKYFSPWIITVELDRFRLFIEHCNYIGNESISMV